MEGTQGEKHGSPRPCKLSVRQDLIDPGRVGSIDVTLKQRHQRPREKQQSCTSFSVICRAIRSIPPRKTTVQSRGQRAVVKGSQTQEQCIPLELPALIPIERMQQTTKEVRQPPPLIPIPQKNSAHPDEVTPEPSFLSVPTSSPQTPPLDLTQTSSTSPLRLQDARESSTASDTAQQCDTAGKTLDTDITPESESRSCCPLCRQHYVTLASLRVHLGQCTKVATHVTTINTITSLSLFTESYHKIDPTLHNVVEKSTSSTEATDIGTQTSLTGWPLLFWDRHFSFCETRKD